MKKWAKILCCLTLFACLLVGCSSGGNLNSNKDIVYNGNAAVMVDGNLYFANSLQTSDISDESGYSTSKDRTYLAKLDTTKNMTGIENDFSPSNVSSLSKEVVGHNKSFMFVLGENVYYTTPNVHMVDDGESQKHNYTYSTIYKTGLNGNGKKELYTTTGVISQIEALKFDGKYYIVMLAGEKLVKYDISAGKAVVLAEKVTSVALPKTYETNKAGSTLDWNGFVYYTYDKSNDDPNYSGSVVNRVAIASGDKDYVAYIEDLKFIGRERDVLFYTTNDEVYSSKSDKKNDLINTKTRVLSGTASDFSIVVSQGDQEKVEGYVFTSNSELNFVSADFSKAGVITFKDGATTLSAYTTMLVSGRTAYLATSTAIYKADISSVFNSSSKEVTCEKIVEMTNINTTQFSFDGQYVYFFAGLEEVEIGDEPVAVEDTNLYLYRSNIVTTDSAENYQLISDINDDQRKN